MKPCSAVLLMALLLVHCTPSQPLPWRLIELGDTPLTEAMGEGQWILAEVNGQPHWLPPDTLTMEGAKLRRDLASLPEMACGDRMVVAHDALPHALKDALNWLPQWTANGDSLLVHWSCFNRSEMADWFQARIETEDADQQGRAEARWARLLERAYPPTSTHPTEGYKKGDPVQLRIFTTRADGTPLRTDTVHMAFSYGDPDQVVPALMSGLLLAGPGSHWSTWSTSSRAFGPSHHPSLGLPPHAPLRFTAWTD